jgi:hypothetical protein
MSAAPEWGVIVVGAAGSGAAYEVAEALANQPARPTSA